MSEKHFPSNWKEALALSYAESTISEHTTPEGLAKTYLQALEKIKQYNKDRRKESSNDWTF